MKKSPFKKRPMRVSFFALLCILTALLYIGYRVAQFIFPNTISTNIVAPPPADLTCTSGDEYVADTRITPIISTNYQEALHRQPAQSSNLIRNANLQDVNIDTNTPVGFARIAERDYATYQQLQDINDKKNFLRLITTQDTKAEDVAMGWVADPVMIDPNQTYRYSFEYRAASEVSVALEFINGEQHTYETATELPASSTWKKFTAHLNNQQLAKAVRFTATMRKAGWIDTRNYSIEQIATAALNKGIVSVAFDDGWQSIRTKAFPLLEKYHIKSTQYIISETSEHRVGSYMDMYSIKEFKRAGHEIGSHTLMHCDQTKLSAQEIARNASESKAILERHAVGPISTFAYPYGQYNEETQKHMTQAYEFVRTSDFGYNDRFFDKQSIRSIAVHDSTNDREFKAWLDTAAAHKLWVVLVYHRIDEQGAYSVTSAQLERQLQLIKNSGLTILPVGEAARSIK